MDGKAKQFVKNSIYFLLFLVLSPLPIVNAIIFKFQGKKSMNKNNSGQLLAQCGHTSAQTAPREEKGPVLDLGEQPTPQGMQISTNKYGRCLIATKPFKKGQPIYHSKVNFVAPDVTLYKFTSRGKEYISDCLNSVKVKDGRYAYTFDGYMNHSCSQNTTSVKKEDSLEYTEYAIKDIGVGEEIVCNYLHFDYECDGHAFTCQCGSQDCYGEIRGFRNLGLRQQIGLLDRVYKEMISLWLKDNPRIILIEDMKVPDCLQICQSETKNKKLISKRKIQKGEPIFNLTSLPIAQDSILIAKIDNKYEQIELPIQKDSNKFRYFCSFMNHSDEPNSAITVDGDAEIGVCIRDIEAGEEVTFDEKTLKYL